MSHHRIEARNLSYSYPTGNAAVTDVSFVITHGESVGLLGANGAGKSTVIHLLMGVLEATGGDVYIGDVRVTKRTLPLMRSHLGLVFQNPDDQLFMQTVYDDVAFGPRNAGLDEAEVDKRVREALERARIPHLAARAPYRCSGGEKRAAAIATVLAMSPDVLILDEPTSDLDPKSRRNAIGYLADFTHTKIIASHDIDMISQICERVIILKGGRVAADGAARDILRDERLMEEADLA